MLVLTWAAAVLVAALAGAPDGLLTPAVVVSAVLVLPAKMRVYAPLARSVSVLFER